MYHRNNMSHILISFCFHICCVCCFVFFFFFYISVARVYESYKSVKWFRFFICQKIEMGKDFYGNLWSKWHAKWWTRTAVAVATKTQHNKRCVRFHLVRSFMDHILFLIFLLQSNAKNPTDDAGINSNQKHRNLIQLSSLLFIWLPLCKLQYLEQLLPNQPNKRSIFSSKSAWFKTSIMYAKAQRVFNWCKRTAHTHKQSKR